MQRIVTFDSQAGLSNFDLDRVLNQILAILRDYFHLQAGAFLLLDPVERRLTIRAQFGLDITANDGHVPLGQGLAGTAAEQKKLVYVPDLSNHPSGVLQTSDARSEVAVPLLVGDELLGVLDCQCREPN